MRIVNPGQFNNNRLKSNYISKKYALLFVTLSILTLLFVYFRNTDEVSAPIVESSQTTVSTEELSTDELEAKKEGFRQFNGNEFRLLFDNYLNPTLQKLEVAPSITGNDIADARIRKIAEDRGYKLRSVPVDDNLPFHRGIPLVDEVIQPMKDLENAATEAGLGMRVVSGYRSVKEQRDLFVARLAAEGINTNDVENGIADNEINRVLIEAAIPGYSKHHTGYTVDLICDGFVFENFKNSNCHSWLQKNNFEIAKTYGFIPSYPMDADIQGPDPEAWEYVWVGIDLLKY